MNTVHIVNVGALSAHCRCTQCTQFTLCTQCAHCAHYTPSAPFPHCRTTERLFHNCKSIFDTIDITYTPNQIHTTVYTKITLTPT